MFIKNRRLTVSTIFVFLVLVLYGAYTALRVLSTEKTKEIDSNNDSNNNILEEFDASIDSFSDGFSECSPKARNIITHIYYYSTGLFLHSDVIIGKDGWLFLNSDGSIDDYTGKNAAFTEQDTISIENNLKEIQNYLRNKNIKVCFLVPPNKESIYSKYMPSYYVKVDETRTDKLLQYLSKSGINVVNPKSVLLNFDKSYLTYYQCDSHWNELGAYIGTKCVLESFGLELPDLSNEMIEEGKTQLHNDLIMLSGSSGLFEADYGYEVKNTNHNNLPYDYSLTHYYNNKAKYPQTVLVVGDSFRVAMSPTLCKTFKNAYFVHRSKYTKQIIDDIKPDYVVLEFVERYSGDMKSFSISD